MGRKAGVAAADTRARLLSSAAKVFARRGYDGASIAEITSEAGLTSGAVYAHYESKAELFVATLRSHGERELDRMLGQSEPANLLDLMAVIAATFDRRDPEEGSLLVAAIVAASRHPEVAAHLGAGMAQRETFFSALIRAGQDAGGVADDVSAASLARLALMVALGSLLVGVLDLDPPQHDDWARVVDRLIGAFRAP